MQGTNVLFGQIAVVFGIVIAGVWGATQWTAAALGYQVRLGSPWFDFRHAGLSPVEAVRVVVLLRCLRAARLRHGGAIAGGSGLLAVLVAIACRSGARGNHAWSRPMARHAGQAEDIRKAGLTQPIGVFLGQHDGKYLRHEGPEHVLTFAPTRSGKGVGLVVPTLLLAGIRRHPRHQGRELADHRRLALALLALPAVQPDRCEVGGLQPAAGSAARRA
jgi:type IV secretion system protein VirD4